MEKRTSAARGQTIVESYSRDDSSYNVGNDITGGKKMGGSPTNLSATLSGNSATQTQKGRADKFD